MARPATAARVCSASATRVMRARPAHRPTSVVSAAPSAQQAAPSVRRKAPFQMGPSAGARRFATKATARCARATKPACRRIGATRAAPSAPPACSTAATKACPSTQVWCVAMATTSFATRASAARAALSTEASSSPMRVALVQRRASVACPRRQPPSGHRSPTARPALVASATWARVACVRMARAAPSLVTVTSPASSAGAAHPCACLRRRPRK